MAFATSKELQEKAKNELGKDPMRIQEDINSIRRWLEKKPHLNARPDDLWILVFLRGCKYNLEKTKQKIDMYYRSKTRITDFYSDRDPSLTEIQEAINRPGIVVLPKTTGPAEPKLLLCRVGCNDFETVSVTAFTKAMIMILDILCMEDPNCTISGITLVVDLKDMDYRYIRQLSPGFFKDALTCLRSSHPLRVKGAYFINAPPIYKIVYNIIKLVVSKKLKERIKLYSKIEEVYDELPLSIFPKDYGGEQPSCDEISADWKLKLENHRNWFLEDAQYRFEE